MTYTLLMRGRDTRLTRDASSVVCKVSPLFHSFLRLFLIVVLVLDGVMCPSRRSSPAPHTPCSSSAPENSRSPACMEYSVCLITCTRFRRVIRAREKNRHMIDGSLRSDSYEILRPHVCHVPLLSHVPFLALTTHQANDTMQQQTESDI